MSGVQGATVIVVGGGVVGLAVAAALAGAGATVTLHEPRTADDGASGVAAGMIAPAFETALDPALAGRYSLLRTARDLWPAFADSIGAADAVDRSGAIWVAQEQGCEAGAAERMALSLAATGAGFERITGAEARARQPALSDRIAAAIYTPDDWRLDPPVLLTALRTALTLAGGRISSARLEPTDLNGRADAVVLAVGAEVGPWLPWAPELAALTPVKGQILHFASGPTAGPMLRSLLGYVTPQVRGAIAGATMEVGIDDATPDPATLAILRRGASALVPGLAAAPARGLAGVRAACPDALPLVGSVSGGQLRSIGRVVLAGGMRRNGWLLAPLVAEMVLAELGGGAPHPLAAAFDPRRFSDPAQTGAHSLARLSDNGE